MGLLTVRRAPTREPPTREVPNTTRPFVMLGHGTDEVAPATSSPVLGGPRVYAGESVSSWKVPRRALASDGSPMCRWGLR